MQDPDEVGLRNKIPFLGDPITSSIFLLYASEMCFLHDHDQLSLGESQFMGTSSWRMLNNCEQPEFCEGFEGKADLLSADKCACQGLL